MAVGETPDLLTVEEAARVLRIGRTTAYKEVRRCLATGGREGIPVIVVGALLRVPRVLLEAMIGGPVHLPPPPVRSIASPTEVVDLRRPRTTKPASRVRRTTTGTPSELPIEHRLIAR